MLAGDTSAHVRAAVARCGDPGDEALAALAGDREYMVRSWVAWNAFCS